MLRQQELPYIIRKTACELFAGRKGLTQEEMQQLFREEIQDAIPFRPSIEGSSFWSGLGRTLEHSAYQQKLSPGPFDTRAKALEYWLRQLPIQRQKDLLLRMCRDPHFPMSKGRPSQQERDRLAALLTNFVIDQQVSSTLQRLDSTSVVRAWQAATERCGSDPAGAITAARALLESVCKHILDDQGLEYDTKADLPKLYTQVAQSLTIAPSQQSERTFRQILGSCQSVVEGVGVLRNQLGDAHGQGRSGVKVDFPYAVVAVNLAGSMAMFLVQVAETAQVLKSPPWQGE